jgi:hypothetical protein
MSLVWFMVEPMISGQSDLVNPTSLKFGQNLRPCLAGNVFAKGFFFLFKCVFDKHL